MIKISAWLAGVIFVVSACASPAAGRPVISERDQKLVDQQIYDELEYFRYIDPCGILDPELLGAVGTVSEGVVPLEPGWVCFRDLTLGSGESVVVLVEVGLPVDRTKTIPIDLGLTEALHSKETCRVHVPHAGHGLPSPNNYDFTLGVTAFRSQRGPDGSLVSICDVTGVVAKSLVNKLRYVPVFRDRRTAPFAAKDPCQPVRAMGAVVGIFQKFARSSLGACTITGDVATIDIVYGIGDQSTLTAQPGDSITIGNRTGKQHRSGPSACTIAWVPWVGDIAKVTLTHKDAPLDQTCVNTTRATNAINTMLEAK